MDLFLRVHQWLYVHTGGWIGHRLILVPSLLLTTRGRKSGLPRTIALIYARDGAAYVVVGSNNGGERSPAWYFNVLADPAVQIQIGRSKMRAVARPVERGDPDYERLWRLVNANNHNRYDGYQARTSRPIPLVVITPA